MARYTAEQIYAFALEAGFDPESATTMTAVALAESGGRGSAHATSGEDSRGLWQINAGAHPDLARRYDLFDPRQNAQAAFEVSRHGQDISPWTTTHGGGRASYLRFRDQAQAAAVAHGEPAGLGVWSGTDGYSDHQGASSGSHPAASAASMASAEEHGPAPALSVHEVTDTAGAFGASAMIGDNPFEVVAGGIGSSSAAISDNPFELPAADTHRTVTHDGVTESFVEAALDQSGDKYVFGAPSALNNPDPKVFDCSELVRWAGHRSGVDLPDGSWAQFLDLKSKGLVVPVEEGIHTRGALLFAFSSEPEPGGPRPSHAHVAISLGDGSTIEARGRAYGVGSFEANEKRFGYAALLPGTSSSHAAAATHGDDVTASSYGAPEPVALDTDLAPGHGFSSTQVDELPPGPSDDLPLDPFTVDSDPQRLADSVDLLFGDNAGAATGFESIDLTDLNGPASPDPLDHAVNAALDSVEMTPFDGYDAPAGSGDTGDTHDSGHAGEAVSVQDAALPADDAAQPDHLSEHSGDDTVPDHGGHGLSSTSIESDPTSHSGFAAPEAPLGGHDDSPDGHGLSSGHV